MKNLGYKDKPYFQTNPGKQGSVKAHLLKMTVYDSNNEVFFYEEIEVETQRQGRIQGYLKVLAKLFGPDKEWY